MTIKPMMCTGLKPNNVTTISLKEFKTTITPLHLAHLCSSKQYTCITGNSANFIFIRSCLFGIAKTVEDSKISCHQIN